MRKRLPGDPASYSYCPERRGRVISRQDPSITRSAPFVRPSFVPTFDPSLDPRASSLTPAPILDYAVLRVDRGRRPAPHQPLGNFPNLSGECATVVDPADAVCIKGGGVLECNATSANPARRYDTKVTNKLTRSALQTRNVGNPAAPSLAAPGDVWDVVGAKFRPTTSCWLPNNPYPCKN